jgi:hypothetical protein
MKTNPFYDRAPDIRYESLPDLLAGLNQPIEVDGIAVQDMVFEAQSHGPELRTLSGSLDFTNNGFCQICKVLWAPAAFVRRLPVDVATNVLNSCASGMRDGYRVKVATSYDTIVGVVEERQALPGSPTDEEVAAFACELQEQQLLDADCGIYANDRGVRLFLPLAGTRTIVCGSGQGPEEVAIRRGVAIASSMVGAGQYRIEAYIDITGGMSGRLLWADKKVRAAVLFGKNDDSRVAFDSSLSIVKSLADIPLAPEASGLLERTMTDHAPSGDQAVVRWLAAYKISGGEGRAIIGHLAHQGRMVTRYNVMLAGLEVAKQHDDFIDARVDLERRVASLVLAIGHGQEAPR